MAAFRVAEHRHREAVRAWNSLQFTTADVVVCTLGRRSTCPPQQTGDGPDLLTVTGDRAGLAGQQMWALGAAHQPLPELTSRPASADWGR